MDIHSTTISKIDSIFLYFIFASDHQEQNNVKDHPHTFWQRRQLKSRKHLNFKLEEANVNKNS